MTMRSFRAPPLPFAPQEYDKSYLDQLVRVLNIYFTHLDSQNALHLEGLTLTDLTEAPVGSLALEPVKLTSGIILLVRVLNLYFTHLDSQNPLHLEGLVLTDLTEAPVGLPPFSLYRDGRSVKILLPQDTGVAGLSATASLGSVTVTIG